MAITSPFKSGTVSSASGTTFDGSGISFASSDVGRIIILTNGSGKLQSRKIIGRSSTTRVTIDHPWNTTPWLATVQDVTPANGDSFVVSYLETDSTFTGESGVSKSGEQVNITTLPLSGNAYVHLRNVQVDMDSAGVQIAETAGLIFGWYKYIASQDAQVTDSCHIIDRTSQSTGGVQMAQADGDFGMLDIYGGTILRDNGVINFWRCYTSSSDKSRCQNRWINVQALGNAGLGSRIDGNRSILIIEQVGARTTLGVCNPRAAVSRVSITAVDCNQAGYVWLDAVSGGASGRLVFPRLNSINLKVIRVATSGAVGTNVMEVVAKKSEIDAAPVFIEVAGSPSGSHTFRYGNIVKPQLFDVGASLLIEPVKTALIDNTSTTVNAVTVTNGIYPETFVRHTDVPTTSGNKTLSNGTQYAPYSFNCFAWGNSILSQSISAEDTFDAPLTILPDSTLTSAPKATFDAYTTINNATEFYDRASSYLFDNYAGEAELLVLRSGISIDAGAYNVNIDATAGVAFAISGNTITIKTSTFVGDMVTTGVITLLNGATFNGTRTDANGTVAPLVFFTITGLVVGCEVRLYDDDGTGGMGTELSGIENNPSVTFSYSHSGVTNDIIVQVLSSGLEESITPFQLSSTNQSLPLILKTDINA